MNKVTLKKLPTIGYGFIGRDRNWCLILEGSIFGEYRTKKEAREDAKRYDLKIIN